MGGIDLINWIRIRAGDGHSQTCSDSSISI